MSLTTVAWAISVTGNSSAAGKAIIDVARVNDEARKSKQWAESDRLRGELVAKGYAVVDTPKGTKARKG